MLAVASQATGINSVSGQDFPEIYNSETDKEAQPLSAVEAAAGFDVPDGFEVKVFASEPDVQNPIAMTWDSKGRMWVAENFTYAERKQRVDMSLRDRVLIFEDQDGDGVSDKRTVFTDQVQMLTSVEVGHGGVWLMCPPKLLFIPDQNFDDKPDGPAVTVLDGFEVAKQNHHNFANGLKWGPDGWLYGRCGGSCPGRIGVPGTPDDQRVALEGGIWRYHPRTKHFEVLSHGTTNPWGHDWNEFGDGFFINTVNGHLWQLIPGAHYKRPFTLDPNPHIYELIDMHADHWHFDKTGSWTKSRDGAANDFGGGHAHCGMSIYLGGHWPEKYHGRLFTLNFHGRRANQEILERQGSGYVAKHAPDTLIASDPFFRGMEISYGPNGNMFVLDWSDTGECHESTGVHRTSGRIYSMRYKDDSKSATEKIAPDLRSRTSVQLVELMEHPNEWFTRQARIILSERGRNGVPTKSVRPSQDFEAATFGLLSQIKSKDAKVSCRALSTFHAMDVVNWQLLRPALSHRSEHVRALGVRLISDHWPIDDVFGPNAVSERNRVRVAKEYLDPLAKWQQAFCNMARTESSGLVRLALASTLQRLPVEVRLPLAAALMSRTEDADDHNLPLLVWYGLVPVAESDPSGLANVALESKWPKTQRLIARRLVQNIETTPEPVNQLFKGIVKASPAAQKNLLSGLCDGLKGWSRVTPPESWPAVLAAVENSADQDIASQVRELRVLFGDGRAIQDVREIVLDDKAEISIRRTALEALVASKPAGVVEICLPLLRDGRLNIIALKGVAASDDIQVAKALTKNYGRFRAPHRPLVIEVLASRASFADELLTAIESKKIRLTDLTAFDVRQIRSLGNAELNDRLTKVWGAIRDSPAEKTKRIAELKNQLTPQRLATASPSEGRILFNDSCAKCHQMFGYGEAIGPELTGANRSNIDYLLENIVDPSAVVSKDFNMTIVVTGDGQTFNGLVTAKTEKTLTLQTQNELKTILLDDIEATKRSTLSPMPDGLLDNLSDAQVANLISYLMQPAQVPMPSSDK